MIKKLLFFLFIFLNCLSMEKKDPFKAVQEALQKIDSQLKPDVNIQIQPAKTIIQYQENIVIMPKPNEITIYSMDNLFKRFKKDFNFNTTRLALLLSSSVIATLSARSLLQKTTINGKFLFITSILSVICNEQLTKILSKKNGKISFTALIFAYFHKEIAKVLLKKDLFNLIYKKG